MAAKLNYPSRDQHPVEDKNPLDLPQAATVAATDIVVVITDPGGTPITKAVPLSVLTVGGGGSVNTVGSGNPEGVVTGNPGDWRLDDLTDELYFKKTGTGNTGWLLVQ